MKAMICLALTTVGLGGCSKEECDQLDKVIVEHKATLDRVKGLASKADELEKGAQEVASETSSFLAEHGLSETEAAALAAIQARVGKVAGATIKSLDQPAPPNMPAPPSLWVLSFSAPTLSEAWATTQSLTAGSPLLVFKTLVADANGRWSAQVERGVVDQLTIEPRAIPIALPKDASAVPSKVGMCGAGDKRKEIDGLRAEIEKLKPRAEAMTRIAQERATKLGVKRRAELLVERERMTRRQAELLVEAVNVAKVKFKAVGFEEPMVILEVVGTAKDRAKVEAALTEAGGCLAREKTGEKPCKPSPGFIQTINRPEGGAAGTVRLGLPNEVSRTSRNRLIGTRMVGAPPKAEEPHP